MTGRLAGATVLVAGAGTRPSPEADAPPGNGRAVAVLAAREGAATVVCADIDAEACAATATLVEGEGAGAAVVVADVSDAGECERVVDEAVAAGDGRLDGLVCNVGVGAGAGLAGTSPEDWDRVLATNARSHFLLARAAVPRMGPGGAIVFVSSVAGLRPGSRLPAYDASKAALGGLCRHVALEGARNGIRANLVAPGLIDTPLGRAATRGRPSRGTTRVPLGRQGTAWEVAAAVVFLLSADSGYITGQELVVDGGLSTLR